MKPNTVGRAGGSTAVRAGHVSHPSHSPKLGNALVSGTTVLTLEGELPVEYLNPGDRVITRDSGMAVLREVRRQTVTTSVIQIRAGSLGNARPDRDSLLIAGQEVLIRDWRAQALFGKDRALVPAARLADGEYVSDLGPREVQVIELIFDAPHVLYADGLEVAASVPAMATA